MNQIYSTLLLGALTFTGCGGGGESTPTSNSLADSPASSADASSRQALAQIHKYKVEATPTSGGNCKGATGDMIINGSVISGTIKTGWGDVLTIGGTYVSSSGDVSGGFAKNSVRLADYKGNISNNNATGTWSDSLGCSGTWKGVGEKENLTATPSGQIPQPSVATSDPKAFDPYTLQGYTIGYSQLGLDYYAVKIACDSSYIVTLTRRGLMSEVDHGDVVDVSEDELGFGSLFKFSLIDGKLVVGESKSLVFGDKVSSVSKHQECH